MRQLPAAPTEPNTPRRGRESPVSGLNDTGGANPNPRHPRAGKGESAEGAKVGTNQCDDRHDAGGENLTHAPGRGGERKGAEGREGQQGRQARRRRSNRTLSPLAWSWSAGATLEGGNGRGRLEARGRGQWPENLSQQGDPPGPSQDVSHDGVGSACLAREHPSVASI